MIKNGFTHKDIDWSRQCAKKRFESPKNGDVTEEFVCRFILESLVEGHNTTFTFCTGIMPSQSTINNLFRLGIELVGVDPIGGFGGRDCFVRSEYWGKDASGNHKPLATHTLIWGLRAPELQFDHWHYVNKIKEFLGREEHHD